ncbi:zinc-ribbon domain-containing protein [Paraburkholderia sp. Cpub6]|uniref:zinc-ribbon domain-containing protein n=1 Tax=Paraburkholderia sp. Cpub6 TaxID=2723094 RepID=UPI00160E1C22|nr:zinc ribbon domain-containing protein [Paraburkholderia sp. Cpub6]MBB5463075.1 hypothetical protein [Paraburkholderia sp. Cpub6]
MARFCVKCGSGVGSDARFCDECGAPVRARTPAHAAQPPTAIPRTQLAAAPIDINWRRVGLLGGVGVAVLLVAGGVAAFFAMPPSTPSAADLGELLNADKTTVANATCLSDFAYEKNTVVVGGFDINTKQLLQVLTEAGIYGPPKPVTNGFLFGGGQQYSHTALGEKKIRDGKLCFADGLTVVTVQFAKPVRIDERWRAQGSYNYTYRHADAWIQTPEAQRAEPERFADLPKSAHIALVKNEYGWQLDNGTPIGSGFGLPNALQNRADNIDASSGDGLFQRITSAVSAMFGSRPRLVGKWRDDQGSGDSIEFTRDGAILGGNGAPVTVETDHADSKRTYLTRAGVRLGTIELIDNDHLQISFGFGTARFHRVGERTRIVRPRP